MQKIRVVTSMKPPWTISTSSFDRGLCYKIPRDRWLLAPLSADFRTTFRSLNFTPVPNTIAVSTSKKGFLFRLLYRLGLPDPDKYKRQMIGYLMYEDVATSINYANFFKDFKMPDTFYSWFVIMELHVWMLMVRYMAEGKPGHEIRNSIVEAMWADVNKRKSKLKNANAAALRAQVEELSQQFHAAIIGYDEGIMSDDKVLAGALWRRFFQCECNNPELVEKLLVYVRKQIYELDRIPSEEFMWRKSLKWIDYENP